jgi:hypothetical protein
MKGAAVMIRAVVLLSAVTAVDARAACVRFDRDTANAATPPQFDGPGSFGELQDTVTLDCLTYVGSIQKDNRELVLIRDERGVVHRLGVGDYMGENTGVIAKIDRDAIYVEQHVRGNGKVESVTVRFPKVPATKAP